MSSHKVITSIISAAMLVCQGCAKDDDAIAFCAVGTDPSSSERMTFDLRKRIAFGADSSSSLEPIHTGKYIGFMNPIPIMIPSPGALKPGTSTTWDAGGYRFVATNVGDDGSGWIVVHAELIEESLATSLKSSTVLYSRESGVLSFRTKRTFDGQTWISEDYRCSKKRLLLDADFAKGG